MTAPTCGTCIWHRAYVRSDDYQTARECRRMPPTAHEHVGRVYPATWENDYCGEHTNVRSASAVEHSTPKGEG